MYFSPLFYRRREEDRASVNFIETTKHSGLAKVDSDTTAMATASGNTYRLGGQRA